MRFSLSLLLAAVVVGFTLPGTWAQQNSQAGKVAARPTEIEVTSPLTGRSLPPKVDRAGADFVNAVLKNHDANKNDVIDAEEMKALPATANGPGFNLNWSTFDSDKDGTLTKAELNANVLRLRGRGEGFVAAEAPVKPARKLIAFEFVLIERSGAELADEKNKSPTAVQLLQLEKDGKASVQRLKITALENVEARLQLGEEAPFITSRAFAGGGGRGGFAGGGGQEQVTYNSLGTTLTLTAETEGEGKVLASINLARSTVAAAKTEKPTDKVEGQDTGVSPNYPRRLQSTIVTTFRIAAGETAVLCGQQTHTGNSPSELWVLVSAKVE